MKRTLQVVGVAAALGIAGSALAQHIEITSESLGRVVVAPPPIGNGAPAAAPRPTGRGNGIDLGIRRNRDGSLYDALDPAQNPAAAPAPGIAAGDGSNAGNLNANAVNGNRPR